MKNTTHQISTRYRVHRAIAEKKGNRVSTLAPLLGLTTVQVGQAIKGLVDAKAVRRLGRLGRGTEMLYEAVPGAVVMHNGTGQVRPAGHRSPGDVRASEPTTLRWEPPPLEEFWKSPVRVPRAEDPGGRS